MYQFPIGVIIESFKKPLDEAIKLAAGVGAKGIQAYATSSKLAFQPIDAAGRREFIKKLNDNGLRMSAVCGDLGQGFGSAEKNPGLVEESKRIVDIALELGTNIVTTHIGTLPDDPSNDTYKIIQDACGELVAYADGAGAHFAIETGPEPAQVLKDFLDSFHSRGMAVNLDPANFVMCCGDDPVNAVKLLKDYIVHTHAKDGRMLPPKEPGKWNYIELPLGEGDVPFPAYLAALDEIGYRGFLTIEREVGGNPTADIERAAQFLKDHMA